jgi:putative transposase
MALHGPRQADPECVRREVGFAALRVSGKLRNECLNETLFTSLAHARAELAEWQHDYNTVRPHSKLSGRTPAEIAKQAVPGQAPALLVIPSTISQTLEGLYL